MPDSSHQSVRTVLKSLDIVLVCWNSGEDLFRCLQALERSSKTTFTLNSVTLIDNASADNSVSLHQPFDLPVTVVQNSANRGYGAAANQGAAAGNGDYILFLNPDAWLAKEALDNMLGLMEDENQDNICLQGIRLMTLDNKIHKSCSPFPRARDFIGRSLGLDVLVPSIFKPPFDQEQDYTRSSFVEQASGACCLICRPVFEQLQGFDERFFVYYEDLDLSYRASKAGFNHYYNARAHASHIGGSSSSKVPAKRLFYIFDSRIRYCRKHFRAVPAALVVGAMVIAEPIARLVQAAGRGSLLQMAATLKAYGYLVRHFLLPEKRRD